MKRFFIFLLSIFFAISALWRLNADDLQAFDQTGCEKDCQKCHTITNQEVKDLLKNMRLPEADILKVQLSPLKGLWEVSLMSRGRPALLYVDFSKTFILPGPILEIKTGKNKTQEQLVKLQDSKRVDFSMVPLNQGLVMGDLLAPHKVAVFTDPDCQYCGQLHKEMGKVLQERKDIVFYIILFPLSFHKDAYWKSKTILCNKSLKMLEDAYEGKEVPRLECDTKEIDANIKLAGDYGITGTPALVSSDGRVRTGTMPAKQLIDFIDRGNKTAQPQPGK